MKVLLLIPPTDLTKSYGGLKKFSNPQPSIGIAYIASVLRENGYELKVEDAYAKGYNISQIMDIVKQYTPNIIGISVLTPSAEIAYEISRNIRIMFPNMKIVMGNMHASLFADEICNEIIHRGFSRKFKWFAECRVKPLDKELLILMKFKEFIIP